MALTLQRGDSVMKLAAYWSFARVTILFRICYSTGRAEESESCDGLLLGQYRCDNPAIVAKNQSVVNCIPDIDHPNTYLTRVPCYPAPGIQCNSKTHDGRTVGFYKSVPCNPVGPKSFKTALLLSIFLGMFGVDRFYLGYPAIGLLKLSTFGFMLVGQLIDIILIATQVVTPADGQDYIMDYYGPRIQRVTFNSSYAIP